MSFDRIRDSADKSTRSLRCGIPVVGVALIVGVSFASAAGAAESAVPPLAGAPAPSSPIAPLPAIPPAPVAAPTVPPVPPNQAPVKIPTGVTPASSPSSHLAPTPSGSAIKVSGPGADLPSIGGTTSAASESVGRVTSASAEAPQRGPVAVRNHAGAGSGIPSGPDSSLATSEIGIERSVEAALPRWFAYVWPAIALGGTGKILAAFLASWEGATSLPASDARSLFQLRGITGNDDDATISGQFATPSSPLAAPSGGPVPGADGGMNLLLTMVTSLLALIGLIALVRLVAGEEFFASLRWPQ